MFEGLSWLAGILDFFVALLDLFAWRKSKPNRIERKLARQNGEPPPRRTRWTWVWTIVTPILFVLVIVTLIVAVRRW